jgi:hypothetical protein
MKTYIILSIILSALAFAQELAPTPTPDPLEVLRAEVKAKSTLVSAMNAAQDDLRLAIARAESDLPGQEALARARIKDSPFKSVQNAEIERIRALRANLAAMEETYRVRQRYHANAQAELDRLQMRLDRMEMQRTRPPG